MKTILIVEDDRPLAQGIQMALSQGDRTIRLAHTLSEARAQLAAEPFDLMVLDLNLPDGNGLTLLEELRRTSDLPVLILSANDMEMDQVTGLERGADDYVTKPFSLAVLLAKTQALIRRSHGRQAGVLTCGAITLDTVGRTCTAAGQRVKLTPRDYELLECLLRHRGCTLTRAQLLDKVWGIDFEGDDRAVDVRIRSLRTALGPAGGQIKTVFKAGYRLEEV